jgi:hypothetical protein
MSVGFWDDPLISENFKLLIAAKVVSIVRFSNHFEEHMAGYEARRGTISMEVESGGQKLFKNFVACKQQTKFEIEG